MAGFSQRIGRVADPAAFAIASAHGITPRVIATWNPLLPRTPRVLVPIQVDALIVRQSGGTWANCAMCEPAVGAKDLKRLDLLPAPFSNLPAPRAPGVYLHWALPDALTHGAQSGDSATFPAIPDRWLVLRLYPSRFTLERRAVRGWVLRAGDKTPTAVSLDQWTETGAQSEAPQNPLTAMGHGDPAWAAYYDNVVNRLGFYDDLSDVTSGPLAYLVCGWYSDPALDPLGDAQVKSLTDFDAKMHTLQWEIAGGEFNEAVSYARRFIKAATMLGLSTREAVALGNYSLEPQASFASTNAAPDASVGAAPSPLDSSGFPVEGSYTSDASWWPQNSLYHGSVVAIGWPGIGWPGNEGGLLSGEVGGPPSGDAIRVVMGETMAEALSAVVAEANHAPDEAQVLEAFTLGALPELDKPDGRAHVDARLHASAFGSLDGGYTTETIMQQGTPAPATLPPGPVTAQPGIFKHPDITDPGREIVLAGVQGGVLGSLKTIETPRSISLELRSETSLISGRLQDAIAAAAVLIPPAPAPPRLVEVKRALPRLFRPSDPVILLQGAARSFKHGGDGRFSDNGFLICRLTGFCVTALSCSAITGQDIRPTVRGDDILERSVENGSIPPDCEDLLHELVVLDPGGAVAAARAALAPTSVSRAGTRAALSEADVQQQARNFMVEQTVWWATRDPRVDHAPLTAQSGIAGMLPSVIAVSPPVRPWNPIHLDWRIQYIASDGGVKAWSLGEIDYLPDSTKLPQDDRKMGFVLEGRAHLTGGAAATVAASIRTALKQAAAAGGTAPLTPGINERFASLVAQAMVEFIGNVRLANGGGNGGGDGVPAIDRSALEDIASALESMDVLSGALDNFHTRLRGGYPGDGVSVPPKDSPPPSPFVAIRAGFMRVLRLRLVDCFGQVVDLAGSGENADADPNQILKAPSLIVDDHPEFEALPVRFTSPARLWFRFMATDGSNTEAGQGVTPVCAYLLPNHLDGDLEIFDADGLNLGFVRPDAAAGVVWEDAPGRPSTVGQTPARAIPNQFVAGLAQGLLDWGTADAELNGGREDALSALLRIIDSTLWSVDPFGHTGDEHLALLIGHPVAVLRARVRLEVQEPIDAASVNTTAVPLRLGALTHWQDGLLGYFVNDDYRTLHCADAAVAGFAREVGPNRGFLQQANLVPNYYQSFGDDLTGNSAQGKSPVTHPYVDDSGILWIVPGQEYLLTLMVEPHAVVHATTGLVPRKEIGMRREWIADALKKISPTFRFGPVLVDPKHIRMPVANELQGSWSWDHRADLTSWAEDPVVNATADATLSPDPAAGTEGWLRIVPPANSGGSAAGGKS